MESRPTLEPQRGDYCMESGETMIFHGCWLNDQRNRENHDTCADTYYTNLTNLLYCCCNGMDSSQIRFIKDTLRLTSQDLAKALGVAPITVTRWEEGLNNPSGLQSEVLQGLYNVALEVERDGDGKRADMINGLLLLGIGALIFHLLSRGR